MKLTTVNNSNVELMKKGIEGLTEMGADFKMLKRTVGVGFFSVPGFGKVNREDRESDF